MKPLFALLCLVCVAGSSSCNTTIGLGRDLREFGRGVENKAYGRDWNGGQEDSADQSNLPAY